MTDNPATEDPDTSTPQVEVLHAPRQHVQDLVDDEAALLRCVEALDQGAGPIAVDVERAGGYRYTQRAYLLQFHRAGSGIWLVDPIAVPDLSRLGTVINHCEWIVHAASQDLPSLHELDLSPASLFDTELAGRLLNLDRVGLAAMTERYLGYGLAKAHSAADWSTRPLPASWLDYAALDVEPLIELRDALVEQLEATDRLGWAEQEFEFLRLSPPPEPRTDPWRRTKGLTSRSPRALAVTREVWQSRDEIARSLDRAPGRVLPDKTIAALVAAQPRSMRELRAMPQMRRQPAAQLRVWLDAVTRALDLPPEQHPSRKPDTEAVPNHRSWERINPLAAATFDAVRTALSQVSDEIGVPRENLIAPRAVRETVWSLSHSEAVATDVTTESVVELLSISGARDWQLALVADTFTEAFREGVASFTDPDAVPVTDPDITDQ